MAHPTEQPTIPPSPNWMAQGRESGTNEMITVWGYSEEEVREKIARGIHSMDYVEVYHTIGDSNAA